MGGVGFARQNQQSAELLSETIEQARGADYASVAVMRDDAALAADARLATDGTSHVVDPDGSGPLGPERLVVSTTGTVPLTRIVERNGTRYTVSTYVTEPAGADADYRRISTFVTWTRDRGSHERQADTFVTNTRRGLPLPSFAFGAPGTYTVNAGARLVVPLRVTNTGARDAWNLTAATSPARAWSFTFYVDANGNGVLDGDETATLPDGDRDGIPDTGLLETDEVMRMLAVADIPAGDAAGAVKATFSATSSSDPSYRKDVVDTITVVNQGCAGCTYETYYLVNSASGPADSALQALMPLQAPPPPVAALPNYDTDQDVVPGRRLRVGGRLATEPDARYVAVWSMQLATGTTLSGSAIARLYVAGPTGSLRLYVVATNSSGSTLSELGSAQTVPLGFGGSFSLVEVAIPLARVTLPKNRRLQLRVVAPSGTGDLSLAYGTSGDSGAGVTGYPASLSLPVVR